MSKAFTNEDSALPEPPLKRDSRPKAGTRYFTPEGFEELRARAVELRAQPTGTAEQRRASLEAHEALIASAEVVPPDPSATKIGFGAWVHLEDEDGREVRYRIVGPDEANPRLGRLSLESPLAAALLGKEEGAEVQVELPRGIRTYRVKRIGAAAM